MNSFYKTEFEGFYFYKSKLFDKYNIKHLFSTIRDEKRMVAEGVNFSFRDGFSKEETTISLNKVAKYLGSSFKQITKSTQVHDSIVLNITNDKIGMGISKESDIKNADGIITNIKNVPLLIYTADCVPILLSDKQNTVVCAVHAGWRGTVKEILKNAVEKMAYEYKIERQNIVAAIGPSIGKCCFEVSMDVYEEFKNINKIEDYVIKKDNNKVNIDLKGANFEVLLNSGILEENIDISDCCTMCNEENLFYSYRKDGEKTGRLGAFITI